MGLLVLLALLALLALLLALLLVLLARKGPGSYALSTGVGKRAKIVKYNLNSILSPLILRIYPVYPSKLNSVTPIPHNRK